MFSFICVSKSVSRSSVVSITRPVETPDFEEGAVKDGDSDEGWEPYCPDDAASMALTAAAVKETPAVSAPSPPLEIK